MCYKIKQKKNHGLAQEIKLLDSLNGKVKELVANVIGRQAYKIEKVQFLTENKIFKIRR